MKNTFTSQVLYWISLSLNTRGRMSGFSPLLADSFLERTQVKRERGKKGTKKRGKACVGQRCPAGQKREQSGGERVFTPLLLQLISRLPHHKAVQALEVPPTVMLVTLLPRYKNDQCGVTLHLEKPKGGKTNRWIIPCGYSGFKIPQPLWHDMQR